MKYFTIEELTRSTTATQFGIDNSPSQESTANMRRLVETVLDPARERLGKPIYVNSGYRCPELNRKVGGVANSYHLQGRAADLDRNTQATTPHRIDLGTRRQMDTRSVIIPT